MNHETFIRRWSETGTEKRLLSLLLAVARNSPNHELHVALDDIDEVSTGESVILTIGEKELVVRYLPSGSVMYRVEETRHSAWTPPASSTPSATMARGVIHTDETLLKMEDEQLQQNHLKQRAEAFRSRPIFQTLPRRQRS